MAFRIRSQAGAAGASEQLQHGQQLNLLKAFFLSNDGRLLWQARIGGGRLAGRTQFLCCCCCSSSPPSSKLSGFCCQQCHKQINVTPTLYWHELESVCVASKSRVKPKIILKTRYANFIAFSRPCMAMLFASLACNRNPRLSAVALSLAWLDGWLAAGWLACGRADFALGCWRRADFAERPTLPQAD